MKTTTRDIWNVPPGGFDTRPPRRWLRPAIASTLVLLLGIGGGLVYSSMKRSTAVSTQDAIAEFRAGAKSTEKDSSAATRSKANGDERKPDKSSRRRASKSGGAVAAAAPQQQTSATNEQAAASTGTSSTRERSEAQTVRPGVPAEGVYTWTMEGVERGPGVERRLPKRSHRIITHEGGSRWVEHHIFSEQKEMWFHLGSSDQGVDVNEVRNRVEMGPVTVDRTVTYDPACFVSRFPFEVGQTWDGSWQGKTEGTYKAKTLDHGTLVIGGEKVEVWVTEVVMQMTGEVEGRVVTRSWVAPEYNMVVRQYQESDVKSGPGSYYSEWEGQLTSLDPQT